MNMLLTLYHHLHFCLRNFVLADFQQHEFTKNKNLPTCFPIAWVGNINKIFHLAFFCIYMRKYTSPHGEGKIIFAL